MQHEQGEGTVFNNGPSTEMKTESVNKARVLRNLMGLQHPSHKRENGRTGLDVTQSHS